MCEISKDVFNLSIVPGTLARGTAQLKETLTKPVTEIATGRKEAAVKHGDETGFRIGAKAQWFHVLSTQKLTWY